MKKNNKSGFSLVELMVVVAIIGILSTIAVPNLQRFQARAKQTNAKTELSGIYTAQKAFVIEYNTYHAHLPMIGYVPEGVNGDNATNPYTSTNSSRIYATGAGVGAGATALAAVGAEDANTFGVPPAPMTSEGTAMTYSGFFPASASGCAAASVLGAMNQIAAIPAATNTTFTAKAVGCPKSSGQAAAALDVWTINENRALLNMRSGI